MKRFPRLTDEVITIELDSNSSGFIVFRRMVTTREYVAKTLVKIVSIFRQVQEVFLQLYLGKTHRKSRRFQAAQD